MNFLRICGICLGLGTFFSLVYSQEPELKSIEEVINGIDSLLEEIDRSSENQLDQTDQVNEALKNDFPGTNQSFRVQNELLPEELRNPVSETPVERLGTQPQPPQSSQSSQPVLNPVIKQPSTLPRTADYCSR